MAKMAELRNTLNTLRYGETHAHILFLLHMGNGI